MMISSAASSTSGVSQPSTRGTGSTGTGSSGGGATGLLAGRPATPRTFPARVRTTTLTCPGSGRVSVKRR